jgi:hypothetical protein
MSTNLIIMSSALLAQGGDPITALMTRDWASLGGWSLFIGLGLFLIFAFFREIIVPGARLRRLEEANKQLSEANIALLSQNDKLLTQASLVEHFFRETLPNKTGVQP